MIRLRHALCFALVATPLTLAQEPQAKKPTSTSEALLALRAPVKDWRELIRVEAPGEGASAEELLRYWTSGWHWRGEVFNPSFEPPSELPWDELDPAIRERLLWACEQRPGSLCEVIEAFAGLEGAAARVRQIYERVIHGAVVLPDWQEAEWRRAVKFWLFEQGELCDEFLQALSKMESEDDYFLLEGGLAALAKKDWAIAEPELRRLADDSHELRRVLGLRALSQRSEELGASNVNDLRKSLVEIVENPASGFKARELALESLANSNWSGRENWVLGLLDNKALRDDDKDSGLFTALSSAFWDNSDFWIPRLVSRSKSNGGIDHGVARCLAELTSRTSNREGSIALLPWLEDPAWLGEGGWQGQCRSVFIRRWSWAELPEAVPGLIHVMKTEPAPHRDLAVRALGQLGAIEALPGLREIWAQPDLDESSCRTVSEALVQCGLPTAEKVEAVKQALVDADRRARQGSRNSYFVEFSSVEERKRYVLFGDIERSLRDCDELCEPLLSWAKEIRESAPGVHEGLIEALERWPHKSFDEYLVSCYSRGPRVAEVLVAMKRRERIGREWSTKLQKLIPGGGEVAGLAAALLGEIAPIRAILSGQDSAAQLALLASARVARAALPIDQVASLFESPDPAVQEAAERFLESEDSPLARRWVQSRYPNQRLILGASFAFAAGQITGSDHSEGEAELLRRMTAENPPTELYALLGWEGHVIVEVRPEGVTLIQDRGGGRFRRRELTSREFQRLKHLLDSTGFEDLPALKQMIFDGSQYEFVHLTPAGGRRVDMNNPSSSEGAGTVYEAVTEMFLSLVSAASLKDHYALQDLISGVEVLWTAEFQLSELSSVWARGSDVRLLFEFYDSREDQAQFRWRRFVDGKPGAEVVDPLRMSICEAPESGLDSTTMVNWEGNGQDWQARSGDWTVRNGWTEEAGAGLWLWARTATPKKICDGDFQYAVTSADGKWIIAHCIDEGVDQPYSLVRVEISSGAVTELSAGGRGQGRCVALLSDGRILVNHTPAGKTELWLAVKPESGECAEVKGEFRPFQEDLLRPLQSTGEAGVVWAAIPGPAANETVIGRYDTRSFKFEPIRTIPKLEFSSMAMWVDEPAGCFYVAVNGDLLKIELKSR